LILGGVKSDEGTDECKGVNKGKGRPKHGKSSEYVDDIHIPHPAVVDDLVEHVRLHFVLFFVKLVD
jgi:hypothetical protein